MNIFRAFIFYLSLTLGAVGLFSRFFFNMNEVDVYRGL